MSEELPRAAEELFALEPKNFIRRRNELAKELKAAGDKEASARVAALPRPSLAAWALNQVARWNPKMIEELVQAHGTLREPESAAAYRQAAADRNRTVGNIVHAASQVLEKNGHSGAGVGNKLTQTLLATATDEVAEKALVEGRLSADLDPAGDALGAAMWELPGEDAGDDAPGSEPKPGDKGQKSKTDEERRKKLETQFDRLQEEADELETKAQEARKNARRLHREAEAARVSAEVAEEQAEEAKRELEKVRQELSGR